MRVRGTEERILYGSIKALWEMSAVKVLCHSSGGWDVWLQADLWPQMLQQIAKSFLANADIKLSNSFLWGYPLP